MLHFLQEYIAFVIYLPLILFSQEIFGDPCRQFLFSLNAGSVFFIFSLFFVGTGTAGCPSYLMVDTDMPYM